MKIFEAREAPLYHFMVSGKTFDVFNNNIMPALWEHDIPGYGTVMGNSFSRNKRFKLKRPIRLIMNQERLAHNNKIIPLDAELVHSHTMGSDPLIDRHYNKKTNKEAHLFMEEFVIGDIKPLHRYITKIEMIFTPMTGYDTIKLYELCERYSELYDVPFEAEDKVLSFIQKTRKEWASEDEDFD